MRGLGGGCCLFRRFHHLVRKAISVPTQCSFCLGFSRVDDLRLGRATASSRGHGISKAEPDHTVMEDPGNRRRFCARLASAMSTTKVRMTRARPRTRASSNGLSLSNHYRAAPMSRPQIALERLLWVILNHSGQSTRRAMDPGACATERGRRVSSIHTGPSHQGLAHQQDAVQGSLKRRQIFQIHQIHHRHHIHQTVANWSLFHCQRLTGGERLPLSHVEPQSPSGRRRP